VSNKRYGLQKERQGKRILESMGLHCISAKGSLGVFDAVAFNKEKFLLVQFKATKQKYFSYKKDIEQIAAFKDYPEHGEKLLIIWHNPPREKGKWKKIEVN